MRPRRTRLRYGFVVILAAQTTACTTWARSQGSPRTLIEQEQPRLIRVSDSNGGTRLARYPRIEDDAIVVDGECRRSANPRGGYVCPTETVAILDEVTRVDVRKLAWGRTLLLVGAAALVGFAVAFENAWDGWGDGWGW